MPSGSGTGVSLQYGPFHREESPTQSMTIAAQQELSGEIWGAAAKWSSIPSVKAYRGPLPPGRRGIEFMTSVTPHVNPHPSLVWWLETTPGVSQRHNGFVSIPATVTKNTQV